MLASGGGTAELSPPAPRFRLLPLDPIFNSTADPEARARLVSIYDPALSQAEYALGYRFDIVLRGHADGELR